MQHNHKHNLIPQQTNEIVPVTAQVLWMINSTLLAIPYEFLSPALAFTFKNFRFVISSTGYPVIKIVLAENPRILSLRSGNPTLSRLLGVFSGPDADPRTSRHMSDVQ